jgi:hypothetical protein
MLILKSSASERSVDSASRPRARFLPKPPKQPLLSLRIRVCHPNTCIYVRLLGPCFKTGGRKPFRQYREPSTDRSRTVPTFRTDRTLFSHALEQAGTGCRPLRGGLSLLDQIKRRVLELNKPEGMHQLQNFLRQL